MHFRPLTGLILALAFPVLAPGNAAAETLQTTPKAVVELFTSQGCSSCPPADALLTSLAGNDNVVALAYHVDYWDYAGWKDTFANADYSDRQRAYAKSWGSSRIYTPQMVVNGAKAVVGSRRHEVQSTVRAASLPVEVNLSVAGNMLKIDIPAQGRLSDAVVWLVTYLERADVKIDSGDNAGKSMVYTQVVTDRQALGMWESAEGAELKLPLSDKLAQPNIGIAIIVQQERGGLPGAIIGAATYAP